ncbi:hypothetical protein AHAS_Ahas20G0124900 [Arachis hypogaea]
MESSIGDEDSNYPSFDISDHFNQSEGNIENLSIDEDQHDDKITKEFKKPINQSIQCNWEGFRKSRVREATRKNTIAAMRYRARMQVKFDREKENWVLLKVELRHSHSCSAKKEVHYHKYREQTMHVKCVIEDNNEAGIRPNKTYLALANEFDGSSNMGFSEKDVRITLQSNFGLLMYFLAEIDGPEQKSDSEAEKGLQMLLDSDLSALEVDFLELQKLNWRSLNCVGKQTSWAFQQYIIVHTLPKI